MKQTIMDRPIFVFAGKVGDIFLLNLLTILCSLPLVTMGMALKAMHSITCKMVAGEDYSLGKDYMKSLRSDIGVTCRWWIPMLVFGGMILFDLYFGSRIGGVFGRVLVILSGAFGLMWLATLGWVTALLGRYEYTRSRDCFQDGCKLAVANLPGSLILVLVSLVVPACLLWNVEIFSYILPVFLLFGVGIYGYVVAVVTRKAFRRLEESCSLDHQESTLQSKETEFDDDQGGL